MIQEVLGNDFPVVGATSAFVVPGRSPSSCRSPLHRLVSGPYRTTPPPGGRTLPVLSGPVPVGPSSWVGTSPGRPPDWGRSSVVRPHGPESEVLVSSPLSHRPGRPLVETPVVGRGGSGPQESRRSSENPRPSQGCKTHESRGVDSPTPTGDPRTRDVRRDFHDPPTLPT